MHGCLRDTDTRPRGWSSTNRMAIADSRPIELNSNSVGSGRAPPALRRWSVIPEMRSRPFAPQTGSLQGRAKEDSRANWRLGWIPLGLTVGCLNLSRSSNTPRVEPIYPLRIAKNQTESPLRDPWLSKRVATNEPMVQVPTGYALANDHLAVRHLADSLTAIQSR